MASVTDEVSKLAEDSVVSELVAWGVSQPDIRAIVLTSTRAIADATKDVFSDYDIIIIISDIENRYYQRDWLQTFGEVVIDWWDPLAIDPRTGLLTTGNVVYYPGTRKIDFTLWPIEMAGRIAEELPTELDAGYRVLLDKDDLTANWPRASGVGYAISLPNCEQYTQAVNDFLIGVPYVATALLRGELLPAKWVLDYDMRYEYLLPMLEWYAVTLHGDGIRIGSHGKGLQKLLPVEVWTRIDQTHAGMNVASNRAALFAMIRLFQDVAERVGETIGCDYPIALHERVMHHITTLTHHVSSPIGDRS